MTGEEKNQTKKDGTSGDSKKDGQSKDKDKKDEFKGTPLSEQDIALFKRYGRGPYTEPIKKAEEDIKEFNQKITTLCGIKESDTGLALPAQWNLQQDMMMLK